MAQRRLLTFDELRDHGVTFTRQHLDNLERQNRFPKRVAIGEYRIGWVEQEVDAWIEAKISSRSARFGELGSRQGLKKKKPRREAGAGA